MKKELKYFLEGLPAIGSLISKVTRKDYEFANSAAFWDDRYRSGEGSGSGSNSRLANFKASFLNDFVARHGVVSVLELGCGDGNQLSLARYPEYTGVDVSQEALEMCRSRFAADPTKTFIPADNPVGEFDLVLSLDVIYHLVEDDIYEPYMGNLFNHAKRFVVIYSSNFERSTSARHVRHRKFTRWIELRQPGWKLQSVTKNVYPFKPSDPANTSWADFYVFAPK